MAVGSGVRLSRTAQGAGQSGVDNDTGVLLAKEGARFFGEKLFHVFVRFVHLGIILLTVSDDGSRQGISRSGVWRFCAGLRIAVCGLCVHPRSRILPVLMSLLCGASSMFLARRARVLPAFCLPVHVAFVEGT